jgi:hypothetical protein
VISITARFTLLLTASFHVILPRPRKSRNFRMLDFFRHGSQGIEILPGGAIIPPRYVGLASSRHGQSSTFFFAEDHAGRLFPIPQSHIMDGNLGNFQRPASGSKQ